MNIQEAKQIKIADYLQSLGHRPVKQHGANLWYKSPLRNESEASFKVLTATSLSMISMRNMGTAPSRFLGM